MRISRIFALCTALCLISFSISAQEAETSPENQEITENVEESASSTPEIDTPVTDTPETETVTETAEPEEEIVVYEKPKFMLSVRPSLWLQIQATDTTINNGVAPNGIETSPFFDVYGLSLYMDLGPIILNPGLTFLYDEYVYIDSYSQAFPTQQMTGSSVGPVAGVLGILLSVPVNFQFDLGTNISLALSPGLDFLFRIPVIPLDTSTSDEISVIGEYLNSYLRFLYPSLGTDLRFRINQWLGVGLHFKILIPVWHVWDDKELWFSDHLTFTGGISIDFVLE